MYSDTDLSANPGKTLVYRFKEVNETTATYTTWKASKPEKKYLTLSTNYDEILTLTNHSLPDGTWSKVEITGSCRSSPVIVNYSPSWMIGGEDVLQPKDWHSLCNLGDLIATVDEIYAESANTASAVEDL